MHSQQVLASPPPADLHPEAELDLPALLDLFAPVEPPHTPALRTSVVTLRAWMRISSRRAARWGAVPSTSGVPSRQLRTAVAE